MNNDLIEKFSKICQFDKTMGLELFSLNPPRYKLVIDDRHTSRKGVSHGGTIAAMMDAVLGVTALRYAMDRDQLCSTVESKTNFLQPALHGDELEGIAEIDFAGKSLIVVSAYIKVGEKKIAKAQGTFNLYPMNESVKKELLSE
jgi:uncharacterized protein (TIGR00369 family)